jgi:pimeloyl-ACP methyl ester carboxylesterase
MTTSEFDTLADEVAEFDIAVDQLPAVRREAVATTDGEVSALVWGDDPPRLALLHGGGLNAHTWDATALSLGCPLVAVDLPGHGDSAWRHDADYRAESLAPAVGEVLTTLAPESKAIVGQSLGGLTVIALAASRPELVRRIVIIDVSPGIVIEGDNQVRDFLAGPDSFASRDEIVDRAEAFGFGISRASLERGVLHNTRVRDDGRVVFKHHLANLAGREAVLATDFRPLWPALEGAGVPVLLIRGSRGFLSDDLVDEFTSRVPDSDAITIEAGHNVQEDAPVALARAIAEFVDG